MGDISKITRSVLDEAFDNAAKDKYEKLKVEDMVITHCLERGFITSSDIDTKTRKFLLLKKCIETTHHAFRLIDDFDEQNITQHNLNNGLEYKKKLSTRVIQEISDRLLDSLPDFRR